MKTLFVFNWDIYEYDIVDFGGSVQYTGNVVEKRIDSVMEDAIITFGDIQCEARFQRYNYGNANLHCFLYKGIPEDDRDANRESPNSRLFMRAFADVCEDHDMYLEMQFTRRIKQFGTALVQILCGLMMLYGIGFLFTPSRFIAGLILVAGNLIVIALLNTMYKYYRAMRFSEHKPWLFAKDEI